MILKKAEGKDYKTIKSLFLSAFPPEERPPFSFMKRKAKQGKGEMLIAKENNLFVGFIYLIPYSDLVYVFFFAIDENLRGKGYGSKILQLVKERHEGKRLFLAREPLDDNADNAEQRKNRRSFYIKNGFVDLPIQIVEKGYTFDAMGIGGTVSSSDYNALITNWCGNFIRKKANMYLVEINSDTKCQDSY